MDEQKLLEYGYVKKNGTWIYDPEQDLHRMNQEDKWKDIYKRRIALGHGCYKRRRLPACE